MEGLRPLGVMSLDHLFLSVVATLEQLWQFQKLIQFLRLQSDSLSIISQKKYSCLSRSPSIPIIFLLKLHLFRCTKEEELKNVVKRHIYYVRLTCWSESYL